MVPARSPPHRFDQLALQPLDVRAVRDDQPGIPLDRADEPVEKLLDLPGMRRTDDEGEPHRRMVVGWSAALATSSPADESRSERERNGGRARPRHRCSDRLTAAPRPRGPLPSSARTQASDFGLRPRRATAVPGIDPAHGSQRSAALAPRLASVNVTRITAPFPSSTSAPQFANQNGLSRHDYLPEPGAASAISPG